MLNFALPALASLLIVVGAGVNGRGLVFEPLPLTVRASVPAKFKMASILIVDDDDHIRSMLGELLTEAGHVVRQVADGNAALRSCEAELPDLIITDLVMPDREGIETIIEIRRRNTSVKIIAMSGEANNLKVAKMMGADHTLEKPFLIDSFTNLVNTALGPH